MKRPIQSPAARFARRGALVLAAASVATAASLWVLILYGYRWEVARCGKVPDEYYPEYLWLFLMYFVGASLLLSVLGFRVARNLGRWTWLWLSLGWLLLFGVATIACASVATCAAEGL